MRNLYSWLLFLLVGVDTVLTLVVIRWFGAAEYNPFMAWLMAQSIFLFIAFKMGTVGAYIGLVRRSKRPYLIKTMFWAYLVIYLIMTVGLNYRGYI
jgi:hypothetical protein